MAFDLEKYLAELQNSSQGIPTQDPNTMLGATFDTTNAIRDSMQDYTDIPNIGPSKDIQFPQVPFDISQDLPITESAPPTSEARTTPPSSMPKKSSVEPALAVEGAVPHKSTDLIKNLYSAGLGDADLKQAQENANVIRLLSSLGGAGEKIATSFTKGQVKPDTSFYENLTKGAGQGVEDILTRRKALDSEVTSKSAHMKLKEEQDANDPTSEKSQAAKKMFMSQLPALSKMPEADRALLTYNDLKTFKDVAELREKIDARREESKIKSDYNNILRSAKIDEKEKDRLQKFGSEISRDKSSRGVLGRADLVIQRAENIKNIVNNPKATMPEMAEAAKALDSAIQQGASTQGGVKALWDPSWAGQISGTISRITNTQRAAGMEATRKLYKDMAERLQGQAIKHQEQRLNEIGKPYEMTSKNPEYIKAMKDTAMEENRSLSSMASASPDVAEYALKHNISVEEAQKIKDERQKGSK